LALHILTVLLEQGFDVVVTVSSQSKSQDVLNTSTMYSSKVTIRCVPDIGALGAYDTTFLEHPEINAIIHTASPFKMDTNDRLEGFIEPEINSTTNILTAIKCFAPQVTKVVFTSSLVAAVDFKNPGTHVYNEQSWNQVSIDDVTDGWSCYCAAKKLSEQAFWQFIATEKPNFVGTSLLPSLIFGPTLNSATSNIALNQSCALIYGLLKGVVPQSLRSPYIDVRDLARVHVMALMNPATDGRRLIASSGFFVGKQLVETISQLPVNVVKPDPSVNVDPVIRQTFALDNSSTNEILGITYTSFRDTAIDTAQSLIARGLLRA